jgi:hypothetical protein
MFVLPIRLSCSCCPILAILSWQSYLAALAPLIYRAVLLWLSCCGFALKLVVEFVTIVKMLKL